jgi:hypothetical protein
MLADNFTHSAWDSAVHVITTVHDTVVPQLYQGYPTGVLYHSAVGVLFGSFWTSKKDIKKAATSEQFDNSTIEEFDNDTAILPVIVMLNLFQHLICNQTFG